MKTLIPKIFAATKKHPLALEVYEDLFSAIRRCEAEDFDYAHEQNAALRAKIAAALMTTAQRLLSRQNL